MLMCCIVFQGGYYPAHTLMTLVTEVAMEHIFQALNGEDNMVEDSSLSLTVNPAKSKQNGDVPSVEDVTWADSCLVNTEQSDPDWTLLLDALAEAFSTRSDEKPANPASERDALAGEVEIAIARTSKETEPLVSVETTAFDYASIPAENKLAKNKLEKNSDQSDAPPLETKFENLFLPTYNESVKEFDDFFAEIDSGFPVYAMEQRNESIFKEWDIDIPDVEDELTKQLGGILSGGNISQADSSSIDDTRAWDASRGQSVDDLVAGFIDLSIDEIVSGVSNLSLNGYSAQ